MKPPLWLNGCCIATPSSCMASATWLREKSYGAGGDHGGRPDAVQIEPRFAQDAEPESFVDQDSHDGHREQHGSAVHHDRERIGQQRGAADKAIIMEVRSVHE